MWASTSAANTFPPATVSPLGRAPIRDRQATASFAPTADSVAPLRRPSCRYVGQSENGDWLRSAAEVPVPFFAPEGTLVLPYAGPFARRWAGWAGLSAGPPSEALAKEGALAAAGASALKPVSFAVI